MNARKPPVLATEKTLAEFLKNHKFPSHFPNDGQFYRFDYKGGDSLASFYQGKELRFGDRTLLSVLIGDHRDVPDTLFRSDMASLTPEEVGEAEKLWAETEARARAERLEAQNVTSIEASLIFDAGITRGTTAYLQRKKLSGLHGAKIHPDHPENLLVPARDIDGKLWTLQTIQPSGDKLFMKNGRKSGCFFTFGELKDEGKIYVCEGFATAASVYEALGREVPVVAAFDTGNLGRVGSLLRVRYPLSNLVYCADDDRYGDTNSGIRAAHAAARETGALVFVPQFASYDGNPTDANDLHVREGLDLLRTQLLQPGPSFSDAQGLPPEGHGPHLLESNTPDHIRCLPRTLSPKGIPQKPFQQRIAEALLDYYGDRIMKFGAEDVFQYTGTHWELCLDREHDLFRHQLAVLAGPDFSAGDLKGCYTLFMQRIPHVPTQKVDGDEVPINLFEPRRDAANFQNGTLHLRRRMKTREEVLANPGAGSELLWTEFLPHSKRDFLTYVLPLEYSPVGELPMSAEFGAMMESVWPDEDRESKSWLYREILGAALIPEHPMMFFFIGAPKSGKSTLIMLVAKLLGGKNIGSVDPSLWGQRFALHPLLGKLANIDTDISTTGRVSDAVAKKVIDGRVTVDRKNQDAVNARLPALHLFGGNDMPRTFEGSGAYDRRAIIVRTTTPQAGSGGGGGYSDWLWNQDPRAILREALLGLERLLANGGKFTVPESSLHEVREWQAGMDFVGQFIEAIENGEVWSSNARFHIAPEMHCTKSVLYAEFCAWMETNAPSEKIVTGKQFTQRIRRDARFTEQRTNSQRSWSGIGVRET